MYTQRMGKQWAIQIWLLVCLAWAVFGQGTDLGTIRGTVTDASESQVPGAAVVVKDVATGLERKVDSDERGGYEFAGLKSGVYLISVTKQGFSSVRITDVTVRPGQTTRADARLTVSSTTESVMVNAEAPVVELDSPTLSQTLNNRQLVDLPRDSRDIYSFLYINPNITQGAGGAGFKFLGAQSYGASFSLDGQRSNGGIFGEPTASQPSLETIGELTVMTNDFTAEYAGIANIRVTTKRGGNDYHGSLFYNNRNSALAAWQLRDKVAQASFVPSPARATFGTPYFNLNEFGGSFGGRVPKVARTYFMTAYERRLSASPVTLQSVQLPHPLLWGGDFSRLNDANKPAVPAGITLTADEVANNTVGGLGQRFTRIPQRLMNPTAQKLISTYFPQGLSNGSAINATNGRLTDFYQLMPGRADRDLGTLRIDHDLTEKDRLFSVFNVSNEDGRTSPVVSPFVGLGLTANERRNYTLSNSYTRIFSPSLVNELRGGFNQQNLLRRSNQTLRQFLGSIGFNESEINSFGGVTGPAALDTFGHLAISWQGYQAFANGGRNTYRPMDQNLLTFGDTLTWVKGTHSLKFGADLVRNQAVDGFANNRGNPRGSLAYTGTAPDAFSRFLLGLPANNVSYVDRLRPPMDVANWEQGFFVQDEWKLHPKLTLNLGLRYELITPFIERNNLIVNFDPAYTNSANGRKGRFVVPTQDIINQIDPRMVAYGVATAEQAGVGRALVNMDRNNFAPRFGAAWRFTDRMVLRGGYGVFYPTAAAQGMRDAMASSPFNQGLTKNNTVAAPLQGWPGADRGIQPLGGGVLRTVGSQPSVNVIPFGLQSPRIQQYNATFEREIFANTAVRVSYLGTRMSGLIAGTDLNMVPPSDQPFGTRTADGSICNPNNANCEITPADDARRPFPGLSAYMASYGNFGYGKSNAMQVELNRRYAKGFTFNVVYTLLDQKTTALDVGASSLGGTSYNQFQPNSDYSQDAFVSRHRMVAYGIVEMPYGRGRAFGTNAPAWADAVAGGWQLSWNMFAKSGSGFTPLWTCDNCDPVFPGNIGSGFIDAIGDFNGTSFRPLVTGERYVRKGDQLWNPDSFAPPTIGADLFSNPNVAKRNTLFGPGSTGINLGVQKSFAFGERVRANLGADINNVLNHPLLSPNNNQMGWLGSFQVDVNQTTGQVQPITRTIRNPLFGRTITSFNQEGIENRRMIRLRLRITF